ncbi:Rv3235 family protein [Streptomyces inhibens]|uniref:Rv3235 family protein n=1 Tax=Streptomyces inhibens TaxID=2293571 RepID=UPI0037B19EF4
MTDTDDTTTSTATSTTTSSTADGTTTNTARVLTGRPARPAAPTPQDAPETRDVRLRPAAPGTAPTVPCPRRAPGDRRPLGPAGSGPGTAGRGPTRTGPRPGRPTGPAAAAGRRPGPGAPATPVNAAGAPLPTVGAQRRAHESRPHHWFAHQLVLTLSGQRPVHALLGHALPAAYDRLAELAPQAPLWPAPGPDRPGAVPTVRDCGLCRPRRGVIEAFARIAAGERLRALAFRLELGADSRWRCAALDIGPTPAVRAPAS